MKNKMTIALLVALILSMTGTVCAYAASPQFSGMLGAEQSFGSVPTEHWTNRNEVEATKTIVDYLSIGELQLAATNNKIISYDRTLNTNMNDFADIYVDDDGNEYVYDESNVLIGMYLTSSINSERSVSETNMNADNIEVKTRQFLNSIYGNWFEKYQLFSITYKEDTKKYCVKYGVKLGDFETNEVCTITVDEHGEICNYGISNKDEFDSLVFADIEDYKEDELIEYALQSVARLYHNNIVNSNVNKIKIVKLNNQYFFQISVRVEIGSLEESDIVAQSIYYAID